MKLYDLKNILDIDDFSFEDDEICGTIYISDINEIKPAFAKKIEVVKIASGCITCKFTAFIKKNLESVEKYIRENYLETEAKTYILEQLSHEDIMDDGGEVFYMFFRDDIEDFLTA